MRLPCSWSNPVSRATPLPSSPPATLPASLLSDGFRCMTSKTAERAMFWDSELQVNFGTDKILHFVLCLNYRVTKAVGDREYVDIKTTVVPGI